mgnify:CR=1 FL=1
MKNGKKYVATIIGVVLLVTGLVLLKIVAEPQGIMLTLPYVCIGCGCGLFGGGMGSIIGNRTLKNHPEIRKQKEIEEKDERNRTIAERAKSRAYDMMIFVFGALMLSFSLMGVEVRAIILLVIAYLFVVFYGIFQRCSLLKEM